MEGTARPTPHRQGCICCRPINIPDYDTRGPLVPPTKQRWLASKVSIVGLVGFLGFWVGMVVIGGFVFARGNASKVQKPIDMFGFSCGAKNSWNGTTVDLTALPFVYALDPFDLIAHPKSPYHTGVCVAKCPSEPDLCSANQLPCKQNNQYRCPYYSQSGQYLYDHLQYDQAAGVDWYNALATFDGTSCPASVPQGLCTGAGLQQLSQVPANGPCYAVWALTRPWDNRCLPVFPEPIRSAIHTYQQSHPTEELVVGGIRNLTSSQRIRVWVLDCIKGKWLLMTAGLLAPMVLSLVALALLRLAAKAVLWLAVAGCIAFAIANGLICLAKAGHLGHSKEIARNLSQVLPGSLDPTVDDRRTWLALAILLFFAAAIVAFAAFMLRRQFRIVGRCLQLAMRTLMLRPGVLLFAFGACVLYTGLAVWWVFSTIYLFSLSSTKPTYSEAVNAPTFVPEDLFNASTNPVLNPNLNISLPTNPAGSFYDPADFSDPVQKCAYDPHCAFELDFNDHFQDLITYNYFGFWLGVEFVTAIVMMSTAFALQHHYFQAPGSSPPEPLSYKQCAIRTLRALPSVMFGMGLNTLVDWTVVVRPILELLDMFVTRPLTLLRPQKRWAKALMCPVWVVVRAVDVSLAYIDSRGYVLAALHNTTYWRGCRRAWALNAHVAVDIDRVNGAADLCLELIKFSVALCCTLIGLGWTLAPHYSNLLMYPNSYLADAVLLIIFTTISAYAVADIWLRVVDAGLTVLLLFHSDESLRHAAKARPTLISPLFAAIHGEAAQPAPAPKEAAGSHV